ncbi:hypothetical protein MMYC01_203809, partial [Madurella mycetomatis]
MKLAAELDNAAAELGVQRKRISALEQYLRRRDRFVLRNITNGPEADLVASLARSPGVVSTSNLAGPGLVKDAADGPFTPGGDGAGDFRSCGNNGDGNGSVEVFGSTAPTPAVMVQPHNIRMITLPPRVQDREDVDPNNVEPRRFQRGRGTKNPLKVRQDDGQQREETFGRWRPRGVPQKDEAPQDCFARYWLGNGADGDKSVGASSAERSTGTGGNVVDDGCAVLEDGIPAEVETTVAEADNGYQSSIVTSATRVSFAMSSVSPVSEPQDGSELPVSSTSPYPSLPSPAATIPIPRLSRQLETSRWTA